MEAEKLGEEEKRVKAHEETEESDISEKGRPTTRGRGEEGGGQKREPSGKR